MDFLNTIIQNMKTAQVNMYADDFLRVEGTLTKAKDTVREQLQIFTANTINEIIEKLKQNEPLTQHDVACIKIWIVGDAQNYTVMENDVKNWLAEFNRLEKIIETYKNKDLSTDDLFQLHGALEDAARVSMDIGNFLEKKERIMHFEETFKDIEHLDKDLVIKILKTKLQSSMK